MDCLELRRSVYTYLDGEYAEEDRVAYAAHLQNCEACRRVVQFESQFRSQIRNCLKTNEVPSHLQKRICSALNAIDRRRPLHRLMWIGLPTTAAAAVVFGIVWFQNPGEETTTQQVRQAPRLAEDSIQWHRQQLPLDVVDSSPDSVRHYFSNKLPFAVRLPRFTTSHSKLMGARLSNLREHQAAYLAYQVDGQRVSVFVVDSSVVPDQGPRLKRVGHRNVYWHDAHGYNVAMFVSKGTGYAVASDLDPPKMVQLISHTE